MRPQRESQTTLLGIFILCLYILIPESLYAEEPSPGLLFGGARADLTAKNDRRDFGATASLSFTDMRNYAGLDIGKKFDSDVIHGELEFGRVFLYQAYKFPVFPTVQGGLSVSKYFACFGGAGVRINIEPLFYIDINYHFYAYPDQNPYFGSAFVENNLKARIMFQL